MEIWKDIPNYEGYQASNLGRIRTHNKVTFTELHGERKWKDRILKPKCCKSSRSKNRYDQRVELWKNGQHKTYLVARLVAISFLGQSNLTVNHIDGNSLNNKIENLEFVTLGDNIRKGFESDLYPQTHISLINKENGEITTFKSMSKASLHIKCNTNYLSNCIKRGKYENEKYIWGIGK